MAHFAEINESNEVVRVIVVVNSELLDENGDEQESLGVSFCASLFGGSWKQTSYNHNIRKNFAGVGFSYDPSRDAFIEPKPYSSWLLDEDTCVWVPPVAKPDDGNRYQWNEDTTSWDNLGTL